MTDTNNTDGAALLPVTIPNEIWRKVDELSRYTSQPNTTMEWAQYADRLRCALAETLLADQAHSLPGDVGTDDMLAAVIQYRDDLRRPPSADSVQRRLDWIESIIAKNTGGEQEWEGELTGEEQAMIDRAWNRHVAAGPQCEIPPKGWVCTREAGHDGPCAAALSTPQRQEYDGDAVREALAVIARGAELSEHLFAARLEDRKNRLSWFVVNVLQDGLAACKGTALAALAHPAQARDEMLSGDAGEGRDLEGLGDALAHDPRRQDTHSFARAFDDVR